MAERDLSITIQNLEYVVHTTAGYTKCYESYCIYYLKN